MFSNNQLTNQRETKFHVCNVYPVMNEPAIKLPTSNQNNFISKTHF